MLTRVLIQVIRGKAKSYRKSQLSTRGSFVPTSFESGLCSLKQPLLWQCQRESRALESEAKHLSTLRVMFSFIAGVGSS